MTATRAECKLGNRELSVEIIGANTGGRAKLVSSFHSAFESYMHLREG